jgi:large subunit ribosomal protein L25
MEEIVLSAEKREDTGKGVARKLRQAGSTPGVLYGPEADPCSLYVNTRELATLLRRRSGYSALINLKINGEDDNRKVIIRELQRDPVSGEVEHLDLYQVSMKKKLNLTTNVILKGTAAGVKLGGIMQHIIRELDIACLPVDIPDHIEVDVSEMEIGDSIHVSDISMDKVDILTNPARTLATVVPPTVIKTAAEEAEEVEGEEAVEGEEVAEGEEKPEAEADAGASEEKKE